MFVLQRNFSPFFYLEVVVVIVAVPEVERTRLVCVAVRVGLLSKGIDFGILAF